MKRMIASTTRNLLAVFAICSIVLLLAGSAAWWSIHTAWFADLLRVKVISTLQNVTGGRVELHSFTFNPDTLHAGISGLIIRGKEEAPAPPLVSIDSAQISLKILSLWSHDVDLEAIRLSHPEINLRVYPDGTTNIPRPKHRRSGKNSFEQLLDLRVKHLEIVQGMLQVNDRKTPFDLISRGIGVMLDYSYDGPSYGVAFDSEELKLVLGKTAFKPLRILAKGRLYQDYAKVEHLDVITGKASSKIQLAGVIQHFSHPTADATVSASLSINDLAELGGIGEQLRNGQGHTSGELHFDSGSGKFRFQGKASAQGVDFVSPQFTLRNIGGTADMIADNGGLLLRRVDAGARGARFLGQGSIKNYQVLNVEGHVSQVALQEVGAYLTKQPFPWSGTARGEAHASARLSDRNPDFIIGAKVEIDPGTKGIPTAGNVDITYYNKSGKVEFGNSTLRLPHSTANFVGTLNSDLTLAVDSNDLADLQALIPIVGGRINANDLPRFVSGGSARFQGSVHDFIQQPVVNGGFTLTKFKIGSYAWETLNGQFTLSSSHVLIPTFQLQEAGVDFAGSASADLINWSFGNDSPLKINARFINLDVLKMAALFTSSSPPFIQGLASGRLNLQGTLNRPHGTAHVAIRNLDAYGEQLNRIGFDAALDGNRLQLDKGRIESGSARLDFSGIYQHSAADWTTGDVTVKADTNGFPLVSLSSVRKYVPELNARAEVHLEMMGRLRSSSFEPLRINGAAQFEHVSLSGRELGSASLDAATQGGAIDFKYAGDLRDTKFQGAAKAQLTTGTPIQGDLQLERISLATLKSLASETKLALPVNGYLDGSVTFNGQMEDPAHMHARATIKTLEVSSLVRPASDTALAPSNSGTPDIVLRNNDPILIDVAGGVLSISQFEMDGRDTSVKITGYAPLAGGRPVDVKAVGKADLALFSLFDPNVRSAGSSELAVNIGGPITALNVTGALEVRSASFFLADLPNGLSDVNGTLVFSRNRATIQKMTAHSGGGDISLGGSLSFSEGSPLVYQLEAGARNVRVRYANSISVTSNADLRLSGTSESSILSGSLTVTRVVFTPNADAGNLLAAASTMGTAPGDQGDFISGLHLDVGVESAPSLQVSTNLSRDVEAEIQLRLRGTPDHPIVLGNIAANQGDIKIFGTRFSLNRGEVSFVNTIRVEPILDLDLETQARGVTVDITVSGTPSKLNFNYRSDPPLQPRDIIALLTVGRTPGVGTTSNAQGASDVSALSSGVNSVLGQAISPVSNRLSKLFGITNIKIDPFVQGITNTPQARLSVEQQISRDVTVTYVTNLSQTSEQIFRFEWALSRQFSVVAIRDDNGEFGLDFQYKKRFK